MRFQWLVNLVSGVRNIFAWTSSDKDSAFSTKSLPSQGAPLPAIPTGGEALIVHIPLQDIPYKLRESFKEVYNLFHASVGENDEKALFHRITNGNYNVTNELVDSVLNNPLISNEWKIWVSVNRMRSIASEDELLSKPMNRDEIIALIKRTREFGINLLKAEGNNPDAIKFILEKENRGNESQLRIKTFCLAAALAACEPNKLDSDEKELYPRFQTLMTALYSANVQFKPSGDPEANNSLRFILPEDDNSPTSSLFVYIFHETEHNPLIDKYNLYYSQIHGGAISEFRCDLASMRNVAKYIDPSLDRLNLSRLEYKYEKRYNLVQDSSGYNCSKYAVARAFFESILREWERSGSPEAFTELLDELEKGTNTVLERHSQIGTINQVQFSQFAEELIQETKQFFADRNISIEVNHPTEKLTRALFREKMKHINPDRGLFETYLLYQNPVPDDWIDLAIKEMIYVTPVPSVKMTKLNS